MELLATIHLLPESPTINLLMVMCIVWTAGVLFRKIKQPPVLGELLAGIIFGPSLLGIIHPDPTLEVLAELGAFFLMFYAGLETNPFDLKRTGRLAFSVGFGGFLVPFLMGYAVCHFFFSTNVIQSMFIGLGLSVTAIAVNARVLNDMCLQQYRVTPVIIGASIVDDVLCFALFTAIIELATVAHFNWLTMGHNLIKVLVFFTLTIWIGLHIFPKLSRHFSGREAKGFTFALIMALLFGLMAEVSGLHIIIGAYMAGLFVREGIIDKELFQKINDRFVSITYGFLGPIFFVSLAFHMNFSIFSTHAKFISILLLVAVIGKMAGTMIGTSLGKMNFKESMVVACAMNGRGAVELVIASVGIKLGVIDDVLFSILVVIAFLTTLFPPVSLSFLLRNGRNELQLIDPDNKPC